MAALLCGSYLLFDEIDSEIELYLAGHTLPSQFPGWSTNGKMPARGFGRPHHAMVNHLMLTARTDLRQRILDRIHQCIAPQWDGATRSPVKNWYHIRDDRVLGSTVDAWVPWNESLGFVGMVAIYNATGDQTVRQIMVDWG